MDDDLVGAGAPRQFDRQPLGRFRLHLAQNIGHLARRDLRGDLEQHRHVEPIENLRGILRLHALIHRDDALEARGLGLVLLLRRRDDARFDAFISSIRPSMRFSADFIRFSRISISRARASISCRRDLQALEDRALRRLTPAGLIAECTAVPIGDRSGAHGRLAPRPPASAHLFGFSSTEPVMSAAARRVCRTGN